MNRSKWISHAYVESAKYVRMMRKPRTIEQIRVALGERVPEPKDQRWWGAVALLLISGHHIKRVDYAPAKSSHGSSKPTYMPFRAQFSRGASEPIFPRLQAANQDGRPQSKAQATTPAESV